MKNQKFITLEKTTIKPEFILLNSLDLIEYKSALEQLINLSGKLESFESLYFEDSPIRFYKKEEDKILMYENFEIQDFITVTSKINELIPQIDLFFEKISIVCVYVSGDYYFRELIREYALLKKENVKYYINYLAALEEDTDLEADDVDTIIEKYGWCNETIDLILLRFYAYSPVPHGKYQFANAIDDGLAEYLEKKSNADYFLKRIVETIKKIGDDDDDEIDDLKEHIKELLNLVFGDEADKYIEKIAKQLNPYEKELNDIKNVWKGIETKEEADKIQESFKKLLDTGDKKITAEIAQLYYDWAAEIARKICGKKLAWNKEIDQKLTLAGELAEKSLKLLKIVEKNLSNHYSKIKLIATIYDNFSNIYMQSAYQAKNDKTKIEFFEKSIPYAKISLGFMPDFDSSCVNYSCAIVNLLLIGNKQEQIKKYQAEIDYFNNLITSFDKINEDFITVYNNACSVYTLLSDKKNAYKYLEKLLETNKTVKDYKKEYFSDDPDFEFIRNEEKFQELIEKYFST